MDVVGLQKEGPIAKAYPKSGLWSRVHTIGMLEKRSQVWYSTAQTLYMFLIYFWL